MEAMEKFLAASKNYQDLSRVRVILGNPSCDLDSAVCALAQGFLEHLLSKDQDVAVVPVLNVTRDEFRLKTEVVHHLRRCQVPRDLLTFRNEIDLLALRSSGKLELVLVDHHALPAEDEPLTDSVVEVIDHRPQDPNWTWPGRRVTLEIVGSCATLVARNVLRLRPDVLPTLCSLLLGPILIDTVNFSKEAERAKPLDQEIIGELEKISGCPTARERAKLYQEILDAKTDISELTAGDLLIKDLKVVNGLPIPGFPILVKDFLELDGAEKALEAFCTSRNCQLAVLLGMDLKHDNVKRDLAVYSLGADRPANKLIEALTGSTSPSLQLTEVKRCSGAAGKLLVLYKQANVRATRKQILPIIQSASSA